MRSGRSWHWRRPASSWPPCSANGHRGSCSGCCGPRSAFSSPASPRSARLASRTSLLLAAAIGGAAIVLLSLALSPGWPSLWLRNLDSVIEHPAPIAAPFGVLLLSALLRWRRREGRLLLAMAFVPQLLLFADQLPLMLVARSARDAMLLTIGGWVAAIFWFAQEADKFGAVSFAAPYVLAGCYLPALWIVLRQPNQGTVLASLERRMARWPSWLRGHPSSRRCQASPRAFECPPQRGHSGGGRPSTSRLRKPRYPSTNKKLLFALEYAVQRHDERSTQ